MDKEDIFNKVSRKLASLLQWLPAPPGLFLVGLKDDRTLTDFDLAALLSPCELDAGRAGASDAARRGRLLGRLAAKTAAGRRWGRGAEAAEIRTGAEGRPLCFRPAAASPDGFVSLSHTKGAAAAAAAAETVGLDLEPWDRPLGDKVWGWAFRPEERRLAEAAAEQFPARLALWCAKEAAAKSWGRGLLNHLDRVRVAGADWPAGRLTVVWRGREHPASEVCLSKWDAFLVALAQ